MRFRNLLTKTKTILVKSLIIPILEYPSIPNCVASTYQKRKMQTTLNKALRFIHVNEPEQLNLEELHEKYNITPLNRSTFAKAQKTWETIRNIESEKYEELINQRNNTHTWFPKSSTIIGNMPPPAIITR